MSSRRAQKAAALKALRDRRSGLAGAPDSTRTDDYEFQYEGDVYDVVAEEDYEDLVEKRRQREDFVVDDGACMHCILFSPCFHFVSLSIASASASIACPKPPFIISLANELIPSQHIPTISHPIVSQHILFHSIPFHSIPSHPIPSHLSLQTALVITTTARSTTGPRPTRRSPEGPSPRGRGPALA